MNIVNAQTVKVVNMPNKYELRCKRIPRKYLDKAGYIYGIEWARVAGKTLNVSYLEYCSSVCSEENIRAVRAVGYVFAIHLEPWIEDLEYLTKETAKIAKYTELWVVYSNYKRRVW